MNFHCPKKSKTGSKAWQTKNHSREPTNPEPPLSDRVSRHPGNLSVDSLKNFIWSIFGEMSKLENFPFVVLFGLGAASLSPGYG
jgi:hypothetical protein